MEPGHNGVTCSGFVKMHPHACFCSKRSHKENRKNQNNLSWYNHKENKYTGWAEKETDPAVLLVFFDVTKLERSLKVTKRYIFTTFGFYCSICSIQLHSSNNAIYYFWKSKFSIISEQFSLGGNLNLILRNNDTYLRDKAL